MSRPIKRRYTILYIISPPWGNVYKIHEEYILAHTGATSCYNRKLTLLRIIIPKKLVSIIIIITIAYKGVDGRTCFA